MKKVYGAIVGVLVAIGALAALNITQTNLFASNGPRDCNNNSIIYCGALTQSELLSKYDKNSTRDLTYIYAHYGIQRNDIAGKTSVVKMGKVYKDGKVVVGGKTVATKAYSVGRYYHKGSKTITIHGKKYYERPNTLAFLSNSIDAYVMFRNGQFYRAILTSCSNPVVATPIPQPKPKYTCDKLSAAKITRTEYSFTATASASNGAKIVKYGYNFGDGKSVTTTARTVKHTYAKPGTYTVKLTAYALVNGKTVAVTSANCAKKIVVLPPPPQPEFKCVALDARTISFKDRSYEFDLSYVAKNGATLQSALVEFGDGQQVTVSGNATKGIQHTYSQAGSYNIDATLSFKVVYPESTEAAVVKTVKCSASVSTSPEMCPLNPSLPKDDKRCAPCPVPGKENLPVDSADCFENCPIPGKEDLPKDSKECVKPPVETPPELPQTGLGDNIVSLIGVGSLVAALGYYIASRRAIG